MPSSNLPRSWTNLVMIYNGNIHDQVYGSANFEIRDFKTKQFVTSGRFEWGQLKPGGGVFRWHRVLTLTTGQDYEIRLTRYVQGIWWRFKAPMNLSLSLSARRLGVW